MTLMLTTEASETIRNLVETPGAQGLRIFRAPDARDSGRPDLQIELVHAPHPGDAVVAAEGARIFLDSAAERTVEDKVLHADVESGQVRFELLEQMDGLGA